MLKFNEMIKIREEEDFFLLINLDTNSIIKGKPSFYKINIESKILIDLLKKRKSFDNKEDMVNYLYLKSPFEYSILNIFIDDLLEMDVLI